MYLCKYNLSKECKGTHKDCVNCVLEDIKAEIEELDYVTFDNITKKECIKIIDKHINREK